MKVIDLLNKIANGEEVPNKIRIDHWCYKFEWVEHLEIYYDKSADVDLMGVLSMSKEELNYGVKIIEEDKKIEKLEYKYRNTYGNVSQHRKSEEPIINKINEIIDKLNKLEEGKK